MIFKTTTMREKTIDLNHFEINADPQQNNHQLVPPNLLYFGIYPRKSWFMSKKEQKVIFSSKQLLITM